MAPNNNERKTASQTAHSRKSKPAACAWSLSPTPGVLDMSCAQRRAAVKKHGYCPNCLAHEHSEPTYLSGAKCNYCQKEHHSMLHSPADSDMESSGAKRSQPPQKGNPSGVRNSNPGEKFRGVKQNKAPKPTLSSMLSARITNLILTVAVRIIQEKKIHTALHVGVSQTTSVAYGPRR